MKHPFSKGLSLLLAPLLLLTSCLGTAKPEGASPTGDHEILTEYREITPEGTHETRILFADVGKADAILLEIDGKRYLLDTGREDSLPALLSAMAYMGWDAVDGIIVTHTHNDHIGGADAVCRYFPVAAYYTASISQDMNKLSLPATAHGIPHVNLEPGGVLPLSEGVYFEVLAPYRYHPGDDNNNSLVLKLRVNGVTLLFAADMLHDEERTLLSADFDLKADILKVGHHGQKDASSTHFAEAVAPDTVIISTDSAEEPPHKSITALFGDMGASVLVTEDYDVGLLVTVAPDGNYTIAEATRQQPSAAGLQIASVSGDNQTVTLRNTGTSPCALGGFFLYSDYGDELFRFPDGTVIGSGEEIVVAAAGSTAETPHSFAEVKVWSKVREDNAILYDCYGNVLDKKACE